MTPEISPDVMRQVADARAAAIEEAKEVIRALQRAMPPLAKCSWNGACESALVALNALASPPAPALRTPGTVDRATLVKWFRARTVPPFAAPETLAQEGFLERFNQRADKNAEATADALLASGLIQAVPTRKEMAEALFLNMYGGTCDPTLTADLEAICYAHADTILALFKPKS